MRSRLENAFVAMSEQVVKHKYNRKLQDAWLDLMSAIQEELTRIEVARHTQETLFRMEDDLK